MLLALFSLLDSQLFSTLAATLFVTIIVDFCTRRPKDDGVPGKPKRLFQCSRLGFRMLWQSFTHLRNGSYLDLVWSRFKATGTTFKFYQLGSEGILTNGPENVKAILSTQFRDFGLGSAREQHFEPFIGHGIFTADGEAWQHSRQLVRPCFNSANLSDLSGFEHHVTAFLNHIPTSRDIEIDLQELFLSLTIDIATDFLFGHSTSLLQGNDCETGERFATAFRRSQEAMVRSFALGWISRLLPGSAQTEADKKAMQDFVSRFVQRATNSKLAAEELRTNRKYDLVSELAEYTTDPKLISGSLLNLLLAGRDTTASLLSSLFFVLAKNPSIYGRLTDEISETLPQSGEPPNLEQLRSMPYLKACVNECLRLYPPIPRNSRTALRDTTLPKGGGPDGSQPIFVRKGTQVGYQIYSMHRRQDIFGEDAESFVPERWMRPGFRPGWAFLPFNGGPRICLGQSFALTQAMYVTVRLLQRLDKLESVDDRPWTEDLGLSCSLRHGVRVRVKRRGSG